MDAYAHRCGHEDRRVIIKCEDGKQKDIQYCPNTIPRGYGIPGICKMCQTAREKAQKDAIIKANIQKGKQRAG
jgi:hypothetical protein